MPNVFRQPHRLLESHWPTVLIGAMWLWMFWPMISGQTVCGFRDSVYLYYPLFKWIDSVWASGEIPLWNPYCNYGLPVVGDGSSSVFYPGKLIFLCRFLSYPSRYGIYLSSHILIAAAGAYRFARVMKAHQAGATLAAISYAFGGSVLFQVTNVIYLVSAAWLPFALAFVWRGIVRGDWRSTVWAGVTCALMILGGDPQMVYHVGLIAAASVFFKFWNVRNTLLRIKPSLIRTAYGWITKAGLRLGLMILVTSGLAAIQILPTAHWAARSERSNSPETSNVWQAWSAASSLMLDSGRNCSSKDQTIRSFTSRMGDSLLSSPQPGSQKDATYQFSQPPWSVLELFFPNIMGKPFPVHQRWSDAIPGAERIWTPTIYAGVLTILLAIPMFRLWGKKRRNVWLTRICVFFAIASFGWFGAIWLINESLAVLGLPMLHEKGLNVGPQAGGLYWLMVTLLPKYFMFRYPAKLFVIASLMISVLAGLAMSNRNPFLILAKKQRSPALAASLTPKVPPASTTWRMLPASLLFVTVCVASLIALQIPSTTATASNIRPNAMFGPLDIEGTLSSITLSFSIPLGILALVLVASNGRWIRRNSGASETRRRSLMSPGLLIVALTSMDLLANNHWLTAEVNATIFESPTAISRQLEQLTSTSNDSIARVYRNFNVQSLQPTWSQETSEQRLSEIVAWQRETLFPKHHLEHGVALLGSFGSILPDSYSLLTLFLDDDFQSGDLDLTQLKSEGVGGYVDCDSGHVLSSLMVLEHSPADAMLYETPGQNEPLPPKQISRLHISEALGDTVGTGVTTTFLTRRQIVIDIDSASNNVLLLKTLVDDGWQVQATNTATGVVKKLAPNKAMSAWMQLPIDAGRQQIIITYSPPEFWIGLGVTIASLICLVAFTIRSLLENSVRFARP